LKYLTYINLHNSEKRNVILKKLPRQSNDHDVRHVPRLQVHCKILQNKKLKYLYYPPPTCQLSFDLYTLSCLLNSKAFNVLYNFYFTQAIKNSFCEASSIFLFFKLYSDYPSNSLSYKFPLCSYFVFLFLFFVSSFTVSPLIGTAHLLLSRSDQTPIQTETFGTVRDV